MAERKPRVTRGRLMKSPHSKAGAFARKAVCWSTRKVPQSLTGINVNKPDLTRDYPILATHWFGQMNEAAK